MYTDIMIDIETMSTERNAAITQIGVVAFNIKTGAVFEPILRIAVQPDPDAHISFSTAQWWMQQSEEARASVFNKDTLRVSEYEALMQLNHYMVGLSAVYWAMPPSFDLSLLEDMAKRCGGNVPWKYNETRCLRTLAEVVGAKKEDRIKPINAHDAGDDALAQALTAIKYYKMLRG